MEADHVELHLAWDVKLCDVMLAQSLDSHIYITIGVPWNRRLYFGSAAGDRGNRLDLRQERYLLSSAVVRIIDKVRLEAKLGTNLRSSCATIDFVNVYNMWLRMYLSELFCQVA